MRFCENCGHQLDDMAAFCDNCGARVEREGEMSGGHHKETTGKKKTKVGIIVGAVIFGIVVLAVVGGLVIYPQVTQYMQEKEDQEKADYVVERINSVTSGEITLDSEKDLDSAKTEYDSLTDEQKSLVDNYDKLEEAYATLDGLKIEQENQEKAQSVIDAIEAIDSASLTDSDTSVQAIRDQYDSLTDDQKKLVTNADKLTEYENIVQQKKEQKAEEEAQAQADHFPLSPHPPHVCVHGRSDVGLAPSGISPGQSHRDRGISDAPFGPRHDDQSEVFYQWLQCPAP